MSENNDKRKVRFNVAIAGYRHGQIVDYADMPPGHRFWVDNKSILTETLICEFIEPEVSVADVPPAAAANEPEAPAADVSEQEAPAASESNEPEVSVAADASEQNEPDAQAAADSPEQDEPPAQAADSKKPQKKRGPKKGSKQKKKADAVKK